MTQILIGSTLSTAWLTALQGMPTYGALHYSFPTLSDPLVSEISGGGYARVPLSGLLTLATARRLANTSNVRWGNLPAVTAVAIALFDAPTNGNFLIGALLAHPKPTPGGQSLTLVPGDIQFVF